MNSKKSLFANIDWGLMIPVMVLVILSLTTLFSVNVSLFKNQLLFLILSLAAFVFFSHVHYKFIQHYSRPIYIVSIVMLVIVLLLGIESHGAMRWIDIFGFRIQFSEILKPFLAIALASYLVERGTNFQAFIRSMAFLLPVIFLIYLQPDLGSALIYLFSTLLALVLIGFPFLWFGAGFLVAGGILPAMWHFMRQYQKDRILTFLHPSKDPLGTSYNAVQSIIAVGSGMFLGRGLGESTQSGLRFLPERHTDFIFATISEGLGFVGAIIIVVAFVFLLYRIYVIFQNTNDTFCRYLAVFSFSLILVQFFINIGMNIGILPIVGVTLPFVSYGGSSLLSNFILLGILSSVTNSLREQSVLEIR